MIMGMQGEGGQFGQLGGTEDRHVRLFEWHPCLPSSNFMV